MKNESTFLKWFVVLLIAGLLLETTWKATEAYREASITRAAMENGYVQEVVDGQVVWKKQGATAGEWVRWLVDEVKGFF